jgi:ADP-ribose pyrophosphatase YjhB (NUDIX family)
MEREGMLEYAADMQHTYIKDESLRLLAERLTVYTYPGYPTPSERLVLSWLDETHDAVGRLVLPDGPWSIADAPNKYRAGLLPTEQEQAAFTAQGLRLDSQGRPLHPWAQDMLRNPHIGGVINRGFYYNWGPNYTSDTVVHNIQNDTILLIRRSDTGQWALPGGFIDGTEAADVAARREVAEETGIVLPDSIHMRLTYKGPVGDPRSTLHAWAETNCFVVDVTESPPCKGADDALEADWVPVTEALAGDIFGSHKMLILQALGKV